MEKKNLEKNTYPPANTVLLKQTEILSLADNENKIYNHTSNSAPKSLKQPRKQYFLSSCETNFPIRIIQDSLVGSFHSVKKN